MTDKKEPPNVLDLPLARKKKSAATAASVAVNNEPYTPYECRADGLYYRGLVFNRDTNRNEPSPSKWICSPIEIEANTHDANGENWCMLVKIVDRNGNKHDWLMPSSLLAGRGDDIIAALLDRGMVMAAGSETKKRLIDFFICARPTKSIITVDRTGWADDSYTCFVLPAKVIGTPEKQYLLRRISDTDPYQVSGTLAEWQDNVAALCVGNSRLVFAVAAALAGPAMAILGIAGIGFVFVGESSCGKTTMLALSGGVYGSLKYTETCRSTDNATETLGPIHSDTLLAMDELGAMAAPAALQTMYMLASGVGKLRADRNGEARRKKTWRVLYILTSEVTLAEHAAAAGQRTAAGQEIRLLNIPADAGAGFGLFENLHGDKTGANFSTRIIENVEKYHGTAGPSMVEKLIENRATAPEIFRQLILQFVASVVPPNAGGQVRRAASYFGLVAVAGEFATAHGITKWPVGESERAAKRCFLDWLENRGGAENGEIIGLLQNIKKFFALNGEARFSPWERATDDHAPRTSNRAGFVRRDTTADTLTFYILPEIFRTEICAGYNYKTAEKILIARGWLSPSGDGRPTRNERLPGFGKPVRCYVLSLADMSE